MLHVRKDDDREKRVIDPRHDPANRDDFYFSLGTNCFPSRPFVLVLPSLHCHRP